MKIRQRLSATFAAAGILIVAGAFTITITVFREAQERQLDQSLFARAEVEAEEAVLLGGHINIEQEIAGAQTQLGHLVKYGAIYAHDGALIEASPTFGSDVPQPEALGFKPGHLPSAGFNFMFRGVGMRGVMIPVGAAPKEKVLLLAASRDDLDDDMRHLLRVMAEVLLFVVTLALGIGWWIGGRLTRGIVSVSEVARHVSEGDRARRVDLTAVGDDDEVRMLASDLNEMIERLDALIAAERRFVSNAAHELRSPLTALRGELELALRRPREAEAYRQAISEALESTGRLAALAEDLLALARVGIVPASAMGECSLDVVVKDAISASAAKTDLRRAIELQIPEGALLRGKGSDLSRLLRNLLENALSHAPEDTTIRISGTRIMQQSTNRRMIELAVEDDGPGVAKDLRERIFEPFVRGETEREVSGAGLGLAISREIARTHGGDLYLDSSSLRTRFVAVIPEA